MKLEPPTSCYTILQDHGAEDGGWGPAGIMVGDRPLGPIVYTGDATSTLARLYDAAESLAERTGKQTMLVRFTQREDLATYPANDV